MSGGRTVITATLVSMLVFLAAGGRFEKVVAKLSGRNEVEQREASLTIGKTLVAWAALWLMLSIMADFPATNKLASALALLIMLTMILTYGVDAFENVARTVGGTAPVNDGRTGQPSPTNRHPHAH